MARSVAARTGIILVAGLGALVLVVAGVLAYLTGAGPLRDPAGCTAVVRGHEVTLTTEQAENAALIVALDIGTEIVKALIGRVTPDNDQ